MAKKRLHEAGEATPIEADLGPLGVAIPTEHLAENTPTVDLKSEIETFISLRDELARKLADEIEATELKLAQLKETAASLFPRTGESNDEKKVKKTKPKPPKEEKAVSAGREDAEAA